MRPANYAENKLIAAMNDTPASAHTAEADTTEPTRSTSNHSTSNPSDGTILDDLSPPCAINDHRTRSGPRTDAGKKRSSINATRHGLSGRIVVLPTEDMSLYLAFSRQIVDSLNPETAIECELAQTAADGYWRMKRFRTVEEGMLAWGNYEEAGNFDAENENMHAAFTAAKAFRANSQAFVNLSIYEQRIQRGIEKAMKQLREIQAERKALRSEALVEAMRLRDLDRMLAAHGQAMDGASQTDNLSPRNPAEDVQYRVHGFVYSSGEIELECRRRDRREDALRAEKAGFNCNEYLKKAA
jgi:hypothetical protein